MKRLLIPLLLATILLSGVTCGNENESEGKAVVWFSPPGLSVAPLEMFELEVWVSTSETAQAYEFSLQYDPSHVLIYGIEPHSDFDDDGQFFIDPQIDLPAGTLSGVVDLRRGSAAGVTGTFRIATLSGWSYTDGETTIMLSSGGIAAEDGTELTISSYNSVVIVTP
ncbi:MAG: hypothetical protein GY937_20980 [bacterium]|nr:hypothetical protein [bacterium]